MYFCKLICRCIGRSLFIPSMVLMLSTLVSKSNICCDISPCNLIEIHQHVGKIPTDYMIWYSSWSQLQDLQNQFLNYSFLSFIFPFRCLFWREYFSSVFLPFSILTGDSWFCSSRALLLVFIFLNYCYRDTPKVRKKQNVSIVGPLRYFRTMDPEETKAHS